MEVAAPFHGNFDGLMFEGAQEYSPSTAGCRSYSCRLVGEPHDYDYLLDCASTIGAIGSSSTSTQGLTQLGCAGRCNMSGLGFERTTCSLEGYHVTTSQVTTQELVTLYLSPVGSRCE